MLNATFIQLNTVPYKQLSKKIYLYALMAKYTKYLSYDDALKKLEHYCAYQDRCHSEVRSKLLDLGIYGDDLERIITDLIAEDFLNEQRFAESYARGKFRIKKWGRYKITTQLKMKRVSAYCIKKGLQEIDEEEYLETLTNLLKKKLGDNPSFEEKGKAAKYVINKGYESQLVWEVIKTIKQGSES
jgi:regulatory protein